MLNQNTNELCHYGTLGMKWGIRRYQYKNGRLTPKGKKRYLARNNDNAMELINKSERLKDAAYNYKTRMDALTAHAAEVLELVQLEVEDYFSDPKHSRTDYEVVSENVNRGFLPKFLTVGEFLREGYMGVCEDGQQGDVTARSLAAHELGYDKEIGEILERRQEIYKDFTTTLTNELSKTPSNPDIATQVKVATLINQIDGRPIIDVMYQIDGYRSSRLASGNEDSNVEFAKQTLRNMGLSNMSYWDWSAAGAAEINGDQDLMNMHVSECTTADNKRLQEYIHEYNPKRK